MSTNNEIFISESNKSESSYNVKALVIVLLVFSVILAITVALNYKFLKIICKTI